MVTHKPWDVAHKLTVSHIPQEAKITKKLKKTKSDSDKNTEKIRTEGRISEQSISYTEPTNAGCGDSVSTCRYHVYLQSEVTKQYHTHA